MLGVPDFHMGISSFVMCWMSIFVDFQGDPCWFSFWDICPFSHQVCANVFATGDGQTLRIRVCLLGWQMFDCPFLGCQKGFSNDL